MRSKFSFAALLLGLWLLAPPAQAQQRISPKNLRGVMYIDKGVFDLGFENLMLVNSMTSTQEMAGLPGVGVGVMSGQRDTPSSTPGVILRSSLTGGVVKLDLGFVYYAGPSFNMRAGPEVNLRYGA